jgi:hypothetical protein
MATIERRATSINPSVPVASEGTTSVVQWGAILAGAVGTAALGFVLDTFAAAIGLSVSSTAPTWRDSSFALVLLSGLYLLLAAVVSYGFGGYLAGGLRTGPVVGTPEQIELRDGIHGLISWAVATLILVVVALVAASSLTRASAPSGGTPGAANSLASENLIVQSRSPVRTPAPPGDCDLCESMGCIANEHSIAWGCAKA